MSIPYENDIEDFSENSINVLKKTWGNHTEFTPEKLEYQRDSSGLDVNTEGSSIGLEVYGFNMVDTGTSVDLSLDKNSVDIEYEGEKVDENLYGLHIHGSNGNTDLKIDGSGINYKSEYENIEIDLFDAHLDAGIFSTELKVDKYGVDYESTRASFALDVYGVELSGADKQTELHCGLYGEPGERRAGFNYSEVEASAELNFSDLLGDGYILDLKAQGPGKSADFSAGEDGANFGCGTYTIYVEGTFGHFSDDCNHDGQFTIGFAAGGVGIPSFGLHWGDADEDGYREFGGKFGITIPGAGSIIIDFRFELAVSDEDFIKLGNDIKNAFEKFGNETANEFEKMAEKVDSGWQNFEHDTSKIFLRAGGDIESVFRDTDVFFCDIGDGFKEFGHDIESGFNVFGRDVEDTFKDIGHDIEKGFNDFGEKMRNIFRF